MKTIVVVSLLAIVVWLFAEAESLGDAEVSARIEFPPASSSAFLISSEPRSPSVRIGMRGAKSALQRASSILETPIRLEPGRGGVPDADGTYTIDLTEALRASPAIADTRVTLEWVRPPTITVKLEDLETRPYDIQATLPGVQTEGAIEIVPRVAQVRAPVAVHTEFAETAFVQARPPQDQAALPPGVHTITIPLSLPPALQQRPGVTLLTDRAELRFTVVSTLVTETLSAVPVQTLLAPTEANEWRITIAPQDQILSIEMTGPRQIMSDLKSATVSASIVAVLALSDIDLQSGRTSKPVAFAMLRDGVLQNLPREVTVRADRSEVRFTVERMTQE
jgi:hypothetical protein